MKIKTLKKLWNSIIAFINISTITLFVNSVSGLTVLELRAFINSSEFEFENIPELEISAEKVHPEFYSYFKFNNISPVDYSKKKHLSFDPRRHMYYGPFEELSQTHRAKITFNICYERCIDAGFNPYIQDIEFFIELLKEIHDIEFKEVRIRELDGYLNYFDLTEYRIEGWYFQRSIPKSWYDLKYNLIVYLIEKRVMPGHDLKKDYEFLRRVTDRFGEYRFIHEKFLKRM